MTANVWARPVWQIDWSDDGFTSLDTIPDDHVVGYDLDVGGIDDELAPIPSDGTLTLNAPDGRYRRAGQYTAAQLTGLHRWRVLVRGTLHACGRATPVAGLPLLDSTGPTTWIIESEATPAMLSRNRWRLDAADLTAWCTQVSAASGVTVTERLGATVTAAADMDDIDFTGTLTGLLGRVARAIGGWPITRPDGSVLLVQSQTATELAPSGSIDAATAIIDAARTRYGPRHDLVRTITEVPYPTENDPKRRVVQLGPSSLRSLYGHRSVTIEAWAGLASALSSGYLWASPWIELELALIDAASDGSAGEVARVNAQALYVRTGNIITATLPDGTVARVLIVGLRLVGGYGRPPLRIARGIVVHTTAGAPAPPLITDFGESLPVFAPPRPRLAVDGGTVSVSWFPGLGNADVDRVSAYSRAGAVSVIRDRAPPVTDMPGVGAWAYRLRIPPITGDWGPYATIEVTDTLAAPTLTESDGTVTIGWPNIVGGVDIRRWHDSYGTLTPPVIALDQPGTSYDDSPTPSGTYYYSIRHPTADGQWSDWAQVTVEAPWALERVQLAGADRWGVVDSGIPWLIVYHDDPGPPVGALLYGVAPTTIDMLIGRPGDTMGTPQWIVRGGATRAAALAAPPTPVSLTYGVASPFQAASLNVGNLTSNPSEATLRSYAWIVLELG